MVSAEDAPSRRHSSLHSSLAPSQLQPPSLSTLTCSHGRPRRLPRDCARRWPQRLHPRPPAPRQGPAQVRYVRMQHAGEGPSEEFAVLGRACSHEHCSHSRLVALHSAEICQGQGRLCPGTTGAKGHLAKRLIPQSQALPSGVCAKMQSSWAAAPPACSSARPPRPASPGTPLACYGCLPLHTFPPPLCFTVRNSSASTISPWFLYAWGTAVGRF